MPRLFVGNFEFEWRLGSRSQGPAPAVLARINQSLITTWLAVANDGDLLFGATCEPEFFEEAAAAGLPRVRGLNDLKSAPPETELVPWGWIEAWRQAAEGHRWRTSVPPEPAIRAANSRRLSAQLELEWDVALEGAQAVHSLDELTAVLRGLERDDAWVVKANYGMSARERIRGAGSILSEPQLNWLRRRLKDDGIVFFEPWVERVEEAGLQFTIPRVDEGPPVFEGAVPMLTDATGGYRGSRFSAIDDAKLKWDDAIAVATRAAGHLQQLGYFGPLGIDAMRYRAADGTLRLRPLQDINARWTMGRLSLGFRRFLRPGEQGSWLHFRWPTDEPDANRARWDAIVSTLSPGTRLLRTAPFRSDDRNPTLIGHAAVIASSPEALAEAEARVASLSRSDQAASKRSDRIARE